MVADKAVSDVYNEFKPGMRDSENQFSHWFKALNPVSCAEAGLLVPKTEVFEIPQDVMRAFWMEKETDYQAINDWVNGVVIPKLEDGDLAKRPLFVKNSTFSNKFNANRACMTDRWHLTDSVINIAQTAMEIMMGLDGNTELVVRERVLSDSSRVATIYNGLPFRAEFRVFYDFDLRKVIFVKNYWDYDYVYPNLHSLTDKIVFSSEYSKILERYNENKDVVAAKVAKAMADVTELHGPWSVDVMMDEAEGFWLIDMAVGEQSAYWEYRPGNEENLAKSQRDKEERAERMKRKAECHLVKVGTK